MRVVVVAIALVLAVGGCANQPYKDGVYPAVATHSAPPPAYQPDFPPDANVEPPPIAP